MARHIRQTFFCGYPKDQYVVCTLDKKCTLEDKLLDIKFRLWDPYTCLG